MSITKFSLPSYAAGNSCRVPSSLRKPTSRKRKKSVSITPSEPLAQFILKSCELLYACMHNYVHGYVYAIVHVLQSAIVHVQYHYSGEGRLGFSPVGVGSRIKCSAVHCYCINARLVVRNAQLEFHPPTQ